MQCEPPAATRHPTVHIALRLDEDVAGWFWQEGQDYGSRINAVLRPFTLAKNTEAV